MGDHREVFLSDHISTKKEDIELLTHKYGSAQAQRCTHMQVSICLPYKNEGWWHPICLQVFTKFITG